VSPLHREGTRSPSDADSATDDPRGTAMSAKSQGLRFGPIGEHGIHLCVDMQRMFDAETPWATGWLREILPRVVDLCEAHPARTIFSRFMPPVDSSSAFGTWRRYYTRYEEMTLQRIDPGLLELMPELQTFAPPAAVLNKQTYSPWRGNDLLSIVLSRKIDTVIVSGGETDICVLATVLGAVDAGLRVVVATDALCSSVNQTHDALMYFYRERLSEQIEAAETDEILYSWRS
jgi:nicotinamidase-related amidase